MLGQVLFMGIRLIIFLIKVGNPHRNCPFVKAVRGIYGGAVVLVRLVDRSRPVPKTFARIFMIKKSDRLCSRLKSTP